MKRISFFLLPLLVMSALVLINSFSVSASGVSGAAFTTVDTAVDGSGHCANGNPAVNCNLYDGKEFVWLNGGPSANKLGPNGKYFFAVLAPGGQNNPNDGGPKNLSDNFDAYTDRTFKVKNGEVSAYSGPHGFDSGSHPLGSVDNQPPFIRLFPYADTPNSGGVYTLAICSLAHGYPVHASDCKYDAFKVKSGSEKTATPTPTCVNGDSADTHGTNHSGGCAPDKTPTVTATPNDGQDCDHDGGKNPNDDQCTPTPTKKPTKTPTSAPTDTPTTALTSTPTDTPTSTPTETPTPCGNCLTPTITPTNTPTPCGNCLTPTITPTNTPTTTPPTPTPTVPVSCTVKTETADFTKIPAGQAVQALGAVADDLQISALNTAVSIRAGLDPMAYGAGSTSSLENGGIGQIGGFSDVQAHINKQAHHYTFTFAPGVSVNEFSLRMLDYGDWNPTKDTSHSVVMKAFDANNVLVKKQVLSFTTPGVANPTSSSKYGNLQITGDAVLASAGQPGNWTWHITGTGIVRVKLDFGLGFDPNVAFDTLRFTTECP